MVKIRINPRRYVFSKDELVRCLNIVIGPREEGSYYNLVYKWFKRKHKADNVVGKTYYYPNAQKPTFCVVVAAPINKRRGRKPKEGSRPTYLSLDKYDDSWTKVEPEPTPKPKKKATTEKPRRLIKRKRR